MESKIISLTGNNLRIEDIYSFVSSSDVTVHVADAALVAVQKSKDFLDQELGKGIIYGVNTGFGPMASHIIDREHLPELQQNLIRSHAVGIGEPINEVYVLAAMIVRLNTLAKGFSGVSRELIERLEMFINKRIIPVIPEHGAVGASGDLVQLAHITLALMGEGEVTYQGKRQPTSFVLKELGLEPYPLKPKEGLASINGTSVMTGIAALLCMHAERLLTIAVRTGAFGLGLVGGFTDGISERLHSFRPQQGQIIIAERLRALLLSSQMTRNRNDSHKLFEVRGDVYKISETVQEVYSLRCIPQILGPVFDTLAKTRREVEIEMNSVTDNPIVDAEHELFLHGGNFHGDYIAASVDQLKIAIVKLVMLSERRINFFLNQNVNKSLPPFLNLKEPGLTLALQGLQFVATSTAAQNQTLAFPHSIHSIPTNGDNQDVVSMGTDAAMFAMKVVENAYVVLAIEVITLAQALDCMGTFDQLPDSSQELFTNVRRIFPKIEDDRVLVEELPRLVDFLKHGHSFDIARPFMKEK